MAYYSLCYYAQMSQAVPEKNVLRKAAKGNRKARRILFVQTYYEIFQMIRDLAEDDASRYEILLEGYINTFKNLSLSISQEEFSSFLQTNMMETAHRYLQENKSAEKETAVPESEKHRHLRAFMDRLKTRQKQMMILRYYDCISISASAKILQRSTGELRQSYRQIQKELRKTYSKNIRRLSREDITGFLIREMGTELLSAAIVQKMWKDISCNKHSQYMNGLRSRVHKRRRMQQAGALAASALSLCLVATLCVLTVYGIPGMYRHLPPSDLWPEIPYAIPIGGEPQTSPLSSDAEIVSDPTTTSSQEAGTTQPDTGPSVPIPQGPDDFQPDYRQGYANRKTAVPTAAYQKMGLDRQDLWTYYTLDDRIIYKQKDGAFNSIAVGEMPGANSLQVVGDWIYTCNTLSGIGNVQEEEGLYRMRTDGSHLEQLIAGVRIVSFVVHNNTVYCISTGAKEFSSFYRDTGLYAFHVADHEEEALIFDSSWKETVRMLLIGEDVFIFNGSSRHIPQRFSLLDSTLSPVVNLNLTGEKLMWEGEGGAYFPAVWDHQYLYFSFGKTVYQTDYTDFSLSSEAVSIQGKNSILDAELQQLDRLVPVAVLSDRSLILQGTAGAENFFYRYSGDAFSHYGEPWGEAAKLSTIRNWAVLPTGTLIGRSQEGFYQISENGMTVQPILNQ